MAETYRGLTIRIGGDTTELKTALKGVNRDAENLQKALRNATKAIKLDPTNLKAAQLKMELLSSESTELYTKLKKLEAASKSIEISESFKNASAYVERTGDSVGKATALFNELDQKLEEMRRSFAAFAGVDLSKQSNFTEWKKGADESIESMRRLGTITEETYQKYKELQANQQLAQEALDMTKQVASFKNLQTVIEKTRSEASKIANEFVEMKSSSSGLDASNQALEELARASKDVKSALDGVDGQLDQISDALGLNLQPLDLLKEKTKAAEEQLKLVNARMDELSKFEGFDAKAENVNQAFVKWKNSLTDNTKKLAEAKAELSELSEQMNKVAATGKSLNGKSYSQLKNEVAQATSEVEKLSAKQESISKNFDTAHAQKEYQELRTEASKLKLEIQGAAEAAKGSSMLERYASNFTNIGLTLSTTVTPAVQRFLFTAVESAQEIDSAYRDMRKTVEGSEEDFENLKSAAEDFSRTHVTSADQVLEIEAMGGQLGIAVEDLQAFSETVANLNIATNITDAEDMAQKLGQLASITHMTSEEYDNFGDALVRLGNNEPALESDIVDITSRIGSMASICGMSVPDILALSTAVAATGQQSEAAGTAISNTMSDIEGAVAAGGAKLQAFAEVAGVSAEEFANTWESNPIEAIKQFIQGLKEIDENSGSVDAKLEELGITGVRQKQALEGLTQTVDVLNDSISMSNDAWNGVSDQWGEAGDSAREAQKKAEGFSGQMSIMQNNIQVLGSTIADSLAPVLGTLNELFAQVTETVDNLPDVAKNSILAFAGIAAAAGPVATAVGAIIPAMSKMRKEQLLLKVAMEAYGKENIAAQTLSGKMSQSLIEMSGKAGKASTALNKAGDAMGKFSRLSNVAKVGSIAVAGLAAVIVEQLVSAFVEWKEHQDNIKAATEDLDAAVSEQSHLIGNVASAYDSLTTSASSTVPTLDQVKATVEDCTEAQAQLAQTIKDRNATASGEIASLTAAQQILERYMNTSNLTAQEQGNLKSAVELLNDQLGTSYTVTDAVNGKIADQNGTIQENIGNISELIEKKKEEIRVEAQLATLKDLYQQQATAILAVQEAQEAYNTAVENGAGALVIADLSNKLSEAQNNLSSVNKDIDALSASLGDTATSGSNAAEQLSNVALGYSEITNNIDPTKMSDFAVALENCGISAETFTSMSSDQLTTLAQNYDGTTSSILTTLQAFAAESGNEGLKAATDWVNGLSSQDQAAVATLMNTTGMSLAQLQAFAGESGNAGLSAAAKWVSGLSSQDQAAVLALMNTTGLSLAQLQTFSQLTNAEGESAISAYAAALGDPSGKSKAAIDDTLAAIALELTDGNVEEAAALVGEDVIEGLRQGLENNSDSATTAASSIGDDAIDFLKKALGVASPSVKAMEAGQYVVEGLRLGLSGTDGITEAATTLGDTLINGLAGAINNGSAIVSNAVATVTGSANMTAQAGSDASAAGTNFSGTMASGIATASGVVVSKARSLATSSNTAALSSSNASPAGTKLTSTMASGINPSTVTSKAGSTAKQASDTMKRNSNGSAAGSFMGQGFVQGLGSWAQSAINTAANLARNALNAIKKVGQQGSPWKTTIEMGKFAAQGLAIGIEDYADYAVKEAEKMAQRTVRAAESVSAIDSLVGNAASATNGAAFNSVGGYGDEKVALTSQNAVAENGTVVNQYFSTKVVRSDADMYTASTIINRSAIREATRL